MRAALLARVSTEEQLHGYSIDAQRRAFQAFCQARDWSPYREYVEGGRSASTENINKRPIFKQAIADGLAREYDVLVVHKVDRFSRKLRITLEYFDKLAKAGVGFVAILGQMDFFSPWGKFALSMLGGLAELYSDNLSQESKKGWSERKAQGLYCGLLPFGAMKGEDGVPIPHPDTYPGLLMAFGLGAEGKTDREVAQALNAGGYRTAGNQGNRPFTKDTVRDMLQNRFYVGELPDGNRGWVKGKHKAFIAYDLFDMVQQRRAERQRSRDGSVRNRARTYSLSGMLRCEMCKSKAGIHQSRNGRPRVYCRGRTQGIDCRCKGTFLEVYEAQIEWYLEHFVIPQDYRDKILDAHRKLETAYDHADRRRIQLGSRLQRIKELYKWGHIERDEYLKEHDQIQTELNALTPGEEKAKSLDRLAHFLANVAASWSEADQEQRNKLANIMFEDIIVKDNRVIGLKPREELRPFFQLSYEEHLRGLTCEPESLRGRDFFRDS